MADSIPAFPSQQGECADGSWNQTYEPGMSLRDYFAGQALAGLATRDMPPTYNNDLEKHARAVAILSLRFADAMLAERAKSARSGDK